MYMKYPRAEAMRMAFWSSIPLQMKMMRGNRKKKTKLVKMGKFTPILMMFPGENGDGDSESKVDGLMIIFGALGFHFFICKKRAQQEKSGLKKQNSCLHLIRWLNFLIF